jgi:hypothetical protein
MADAKTPEQIGAEKLSAAAQEATATDYAAKAAERFVWKPGDITITNPAGGYVGSAGAEDGTVVSS